MVDYVPVTEEVRMVKALEKLVELETERNMILKSIYIKLGELK